jgi:hypothetical protein
MPDLVVTASAAMPAAVSATMSTAADATTAHVAATHVAAGADSAATATTDATAAVDTAATVDYATVDAAAAMDSAAMTAAPAVKAEPATPAEAAPPGIAAPVPARTVPAVVVPAVAAATEHVLDVLDGADLGRRGSNGRVGKHRRGLRRQAYCQASCRQRGYENGANAEMGHQLTPWLYYGYYVMTIAVNARSVTRAERPAMQTK